MNVFGTSKTCRRMGIVCVITPQYGILTKQVHNLLRVICQLSHFFSKGNVKLTNTLTPFEGADQGIKKAIELARISETLISLLLICFCSL